MRIIVAAVGRLKRGPEHDLAARYQERAAKSGRAIGLRALEVVEIAESRARDAQRRMLEAVSYTHLTLPTILLV